MTRRSGRNQAPGTDLREACELTNQIKTIMKEVKYKGFVIRHDSNVYVNYKQGWTISNGAGKVSGARTLQEAKEWVDENPAENYTAFFLFGEIACRVLEEEGPSGAGKYISEEGCGTELVRKEFRTEAEKIAYCDGVEDTMGWQEAVYITGKEYGQIARHIS